MGRVAIDVSDEPRVVRMVETAVESFGGLDVFHNNAADSSVNAVDTDVVTLEMAVFDRLVAVSLRCRGSARAARPAPAGGRTGGCTSRS